MPTLCASSHNLILPFYNIRCPHTSVGAFSSSLTFPEVSLIHLRHCSVPDILQPEDLLQAYPDCMTTLGETPPVYVHYTDTGYPSLVLLA